MNKKIRTLYRDVQKTTVKYIKKNIKQNIVKDVEIQNLMQVYNYSNKNSL